MTDKRQEEARWYWGEGIKIALEGFKMLFALNGASAVAILTFIGNVKPAAIASLVHAMVVFASGSACTVIAMLLGYAAQFYYGNAAEEKWSSNGSNKHGIRFHLATWVCTFGSITCFVIGMCLAARGFGHLHLPPNIKTP